MKRIIAVFLIIFGLAASASAQDFDYYVFTLSHTKSFCESEGARKKSRQCDISWTRSFSVHGLWPQNEKGWPEFCRGQDPFVPASVAKAYSDLIPDKNALFHQWRKHGTCSGLSPSAYFAQVRDAAAALKLENLGKALDEKPDLRLVEARKIILKDNPGLGGATFGFTCRKGEIDEVRFCLTKTLKPRTCPPQRGGCPL